MSEYKVLQCPQVLHLSTSGRPAYIHTMVKLVPYFYEHDLCYLPATMRNLLLTVHVSIVISEWLWNKSTNQTMIYFGYTLRRFLSVYFIRV